MLRHFGICLLLMVLGLFTHCKQETVARKIPLEDFFRNPEKTNFQLSPDGQQIAYLKPYKNRLNIFVQDVRGKNVRQLTNLTDRNVGFYCWANNSSLLFSPDSRSGAFLYSVDKEGKAVKELFADEKLNIKLINWRNIVSNELVLGLNKRDSTVFDAYKLNLSSGALKLLEVNPGNIFQWFTDGEGNIRMALASDGVNETLLFREYSDSPFKPVVTNNFKTKIKPVAFCDNDRTCIYAITNIKRDRSALVQFDCSLGKETKELYSHADVDVNDAEYSYKKRKLISVGYETWKRERYYLDNAASSIYKELQKLLPNTETIIADQDTAGSKLVIRTFTDRTQGAYYLYEPSAKKLNKLTEINPSIKAEEMCQMQAISFRNREGNIIRGYLTLPLRKDPVNLPVIVIPHGGPTDRNSWGYSSEIQFLANRGFAVFQLNFRGSGGYGKQFWISGFKKWGTLVQDDITDGVQWLIKEGIADSKRVGIYGAGFGGFSALNGLARHPDLYACGAAQSGYINLFTYLKAVPPYYKPTLQMYYEMIGNPETDIDYLREASPVFHADKIKAPVFIAQDSKDPRVKVNETNQFVKELRKRNIPVTYLVKETEKYTLRNPENRYEYYTKLERFFEKYLSNK